MTVHSSPRPGTTTKGLDRSPTAGPFGVNVSFTRRLRGITQSALAQNTGITQAQISKIERGEAQPALETAARLADAFGANLTDLLLDADGYARHLTHGAPTATNVAMTNEDWELINSEWVLVLPPPTSGVFTALPLRVEAQMLAYSRTGELLAERKLSALPKAIAEWAERLIRQGSDDQQ